MSSIRFPYGSVNPDFFGFPVSPLGKPTVDSIEFTQRLDGVGIPFCFWLDNDNIQVKRWNYYQTGLLTVNVYSLTKFFKGRSSAILNDYIAPLRKLNDTINDNATIKANKLCFDAFRSEISLVDAFVDLRFLNRRKSEMREFYDNASKIEIEHFCKTEDYDGTIYWHNGLTLDVSTEVLKMYFKENHKPRLKGGELNKYKIRVEAGHHNKGRSKIINDTLKNFNVKSKSSYLLEVSRKNFISVGNPHLSNVFTVLNQPTIDRFFNRLAAPLFS